MGGREDRRREGQAVSGSGRARGKTFFQRVGKMVQLG